MRQFIPHKPLRMEETWKDLVEVSMGLRLGTWPSPGRQASVASVPADLGSGGPGCGRKGSRTEMAQLASVPPAPS